MTEPPKLQETKKPVCFVLMPISDVHGYDPGHFGRVYEHLIKPSIIGAGFNPIRSDDTTKTDYIVVGIIQKIVESEMVLCDLSARNPNVMYELGIRHAFNKPVTLLRDRKTEKIFDIQGLRYTEYDESLRVDSVQKDQKKILESIKETAIADPSSINSVVQLAGIKAAEVPRGQTISPDTHLLLSAIASIDKRFDSVESRTREKYFTLESDGESVIFSDASRAKINDEIYDSQHNELGVLVDIHPSEEKIFIRQTDGKVIPYNAVSIKSKGLNTIPF